MSHRPAGQERNEMKFRLHWTKGEYEDSMVISGGSIEEIREIAMKEIAKRGINEEDCWSEEIK